MNIEEEYLRKALEVLEVPRMAILDFSRDLSLLHNRLQPGMSGYIEEFKQLSEKLLVQVDRFTVPIGVVLSFANERKMRNPKTLDDFGNALVAVHEAVQQLAVRSVDLAKAGTDVDIFSNDLYQKAEDGLKLAGVVIVRRIHEMYDRETW